jgi:hypothetical protein
MSSAKAAGKGAAKSGGDSVPGIERRKARRRPILETFSVFAVVPKKGPHRVPIHDVSDLGVGFDLDTEGELPEEFPLAQGEKLEIHFYLNQSLYLPLEVDIVRLERAGGVRKVGASICDKSTRPYKAFLAFLAMLDALSDI